MTLRFHANITSDGRECWEVKITRESLEFKRYSNWNRCISQYTSKRNGSRSGSGPTLREPREMIMAMLQVTNKLPEELAWRVFGFLNFDMTIWIFDAPHEPLINIMSALSVTGRFDENGNLRTRTFDHEFTDERLRGADLVL
jgi:hypothetical protein